MRPSVAAVVFGSAIGGPPVLAQTAPGLPLWLSPMLSLVGTAIVGLIAYLWKKADSEQARRWDGALAVQSAALARLEHEIEKLREWRHDTAGDLVAVKLAVKALRCRRPDDTCPEEEPR